MIDYKKIKAVVFDVDGTILDSMNIWNEIGVRFLLSKGIVPEEGLASTISTMSYEQGAAYFIEHYDPTATVQDIRDSVNKLVEHFYFDEVVIKDGIKELLNLFKNKGLKMCVATATDKYLIEAALKRNGVLDYFSTLLTCSEIGAGKDEPTIYEAALQHLGTTKEETLVFEDAFYAISTCKKAGFHLVAIEDEAEKKHREEVKALCDCYVTDYKTAKAFFEENM